MEENERFVAFRSAYLFDSRFCNPARGNEKGRVAFVGWTNKLAPAVGDFTDSDFKGATEVGVKPLGATGMDPPPGVEPEGVPAGVLAVSLVDLESCVVTLGFMDTITRSPFYLAKQRFRPT